MYVYKRLYIIESIFRIRLYLKFIFEKKSKRETIDMKEGNLREKKIDFLLSKQEKT